MATKDDVIVNIIAETRQAITNMAKFAVAMGAAIYVAKKVVAVMKEAEQEYFESEQAATRLSAALHATGNQIDYSVGELNTMATALANLTTYEDDTITEAQALLTTFDKIGHDIFPKAIEAAADMSAMLGKDLAASTRMLGIALNDPIAGMTRLQRTGIQFTESQKKLIESLVKQGDVIGAQNVILGELEDRFGGAAKAMGETAYGASVRLTNAIGNLKEEMGRNFATTAQPIREFLTGLINQLTSKPAASCFDIHLDVKYNKLFS